MNFLSCEYFVAIYRAGSIRKAAGELFITQQALSGQLNKLERELGIQLMLRTTPVELTEAGEQFLLAATRILYIRDTAEKPGATPQPPIRRGAGRHPQQRRPHLFFRFSGRL